MKPRIDDLIESKVFRETLDKPSEQEVAGLESLIESAGKCLSPVLFHMDELGAPIIIDGYTRLDIYRRRPEIFDEPPRTEEVIELSGESENVVVDWIRRHQAFRRNDEKLIKTFRIGKRAQEIGATAVAEEENISRSQAHHAQKLAEAVDACEELDPGLKEEILASGVSAEAVKEAAETGNTEQLRERMQNGTSRNRTKGTQGHFQKVHKIIGQLSRAVNDLENETTPNQWSEELKDRINHISDVVQEWEDTELLSA